MVKLATSGGLGDAVMAYAKISSKDAPFYPVDVKDVEVIHLTNIRGKGRFGDSLSKFYASQGINAEVIFLPKNAAPAWLEDNRGLYDYYLGSSWKKENDDIVSWDINPFPEIKYNRVENTDIVISPIAQWNMGRIISLDLVTSVVSSVPEKYNVSYIGWAPDEYVEGLRNFRGDSHLNKGDVRALIDIICSSSVVVGNIGFVTQLAGIAGKKVIWTGMRPPEPFHPKADATYVADLAKYNWGHCLE